MCEYTNVSTARNSYYLFNNYHVLVNNFGHNLSSSHYQNAQNWLQFAIKLLAVSMSLLLFMLSANAAITAQTANVIYGHAPYLIFKDGEMKITDLNGLLAIKIGSTIYDGSYPTEIPITLDNETDTFDSVMSMVVPDNQVYELSTILSDSNYGDEDEDNSYHITGNFQGTWRDNNDNVITSLSSTLIPCLSPYTLSLTTSNNPILTTQYGLPDNTVYGDATKTYIINPATQPAICYAKPFSMHFATGEYAGALSIWDGGTTGGQGSQSNGRGFKFQSATNYERNFPKTGADGLFFDLDISGVPNNLVWPTVSINGITAMMTNLDNTHVRVRLTGPKATEGQMRASIPGPVSFPILPARFILQGKQGSASGQTIVEYVFVIKDWFINRGSVISTHAQISNWCTSTGYEVPTSNLLTNSSTWSNPSSQQYYSRNIGAGLFSEWGYMNSYTGANFVDDFYWTSDRYMNNYEVTYARDGFTGLSTNSNDGYYGICVLRS